MSNPGESYTDANTDPADCPRPPEQPQPNPPEPRTAWDVVKAFLARLAEAERAVTVEQATAELVAALDAHQLLRTERDQARILAAEKAAWVLGRVSDHGEEANQAARVAYAEWRRLVPEVSFDLLALAMTEGGYARLVAAAAEGRQRMWDTVTRAVPGAHQAQLGPLDDMLSGQGAARLDATHPLDQNGDSSRDAEGYTDGPRPRWTPPPPLPEQGDPL